MCGIYGALSNNQNEISRAMLAGPALHHRGPDHQAHLNEPDILLGFNRLSIIDLSSDANQPFIDSTGRYVLTFNGEVFNYLEIRTELRKTGVRFRTNSDTEVVLEAFKKWGTDCQKHFRGMWALALWDRTERKLFISRDPFGIKPFFYSHGPQTFFWASEVKGLLAMNISKEENPRIVRRYLENGVLDDQEETFYAHIQQLPPGGFAVISKDLNLKVLRYFELDSLLDQKKYLNLEESCLNLKKTLFDSVRLSYRSDVPIWILLSGGLDSSIIASILRHEFPKEDLNAITVVHDDPSINESEYAEHLSGSLNLNLHRVKISHDTWINDFADLIQKQDQPIHTFGTLNHWSLMKSLKQLGVKVVLSGQGSDELFAGYTPLLMSYYFRELLMSGKVFKTLNESIHHYRSLRKTDDISIQRFLALTLKGFFSGKIAKKTKNRFLAKNSSWLRPDTSPPENWVTSKNLNQALIKMMKTESIPRILRVEDLNSMAHSIEERVPFLDLPLAQCAFRIPSKFKMKGGLSKVILREALKGVLPEIIRNRKTKLGFNAPESTWARSNEFTRYLNQTKALQNLKNSVVNERQFLKSWTEFQKGQTPYQDSFFRFWNYAIWRQS